MKGEFTKLDGIIDQIDNYTEDEKRYQAGIKYIEKTFRSVVPEGRVVVTYPTCTLDTNQVQDVFVTLKDFIFMQRMKESGIEF